MASTLERYGYRGEDVREVARVVSSHGDYYHLVCNEAEGELIARKKKSCFLNDETKPVTGDFVRFAHNPSGESFITYVLPRFSVFERKDPAARRPAQTLAVNFGIRVRPFCICFTVYVANAFMPLRTSPCAKAGSAAAETNGTMWLVRMVLLGLTAAYYTISAAVKLRCG